MILQSLVKYYEALEQKGEITRPGWCKVKISFALDLSEDGKLKRVIPLKTEKIRGKKTVWEPSTMTVPQMVTRSSGVSSNFLCDNSSYLLGIDNKGKPERSLECFECAKAKHLEILKDVESPAARAVTRYFETWEPDKAKENPALSEVFEELISGANLVFWIDTDYAQEDPWIKEAWEKYSSSSAGGPVGVCLVTGEKTEIARIHGTIKGVAGAQSSGAALVSFNAPAFESYGKEQSFNAPVGNYAVYAYTTALNHLLADRTHVTSIGDTTVVYWSEDGDEVCQNIFLNVSEPSVDNYEIIDGVFKNLESGKAVNIPGVEGAISMDQKFYILGLAPNAARIAVRFFYQDSFGNILRHLKEHYDRMEIVKPSWDTAEYLGIWRMMMETVNKKSRDKKPAPNMAGAVYRSIISGDRYPYALYQAVMGRIRAEQDDSDSGIRKITRGRAAIIKAFLLRNGICGEEEITMELNEDNKSIAYVLGREFAVLEAIQEEANPGINATIKDRYFNSACVNPATIFPILFKLKNSHIKKMNNKGKEVYYEKMLGDLQERIISSAVSGEAVPMYPKRLSLEEQGSFILGYYHQTQKRYEKKLKEDN
ncbi:type I-C CRISPR-associated protein Cas8c/Csd1 [Clostridium sp. MCC353]|uniref:type I-C CRISPR-associated protein Cas8c/Csd1 n=1 Tax=Clostridium sp. MCC353 TaxID=2592646 RepID=UPI001C021647|nr:type I-C CRISPR-associated protein Cas8c/Csd1 [Clostridium sp. MCC353]MBT9775991.1 type I-C CRISPR-associated protein Cas8c/Csd1 [Clostridium sp. MCC353]